MYWHCWQVSMVTACPNIWRTCPGGVAGVLFHQVCRCTEWGWTLGLEVQQGVGDGTFATLCGGRTRGTDRGLGCLIHHLPMRKSGSGLGSPERLSGIQPQRFSRRGWKNPGTPTFNQPPGPDLKRMQEIQEIQEASSGVSQHELHCGSVLSILQLPDNHDKSSADNFFLCCFIRYNLILFYTMWSMLKALGCRE